MVKPVIGYDAVALSPDGSEVIILDQTLLPNQESFISLTTAEDVFEAISKLKVRGAPAIGVAAAFGLAMCMNRFNTDSISDFEKEFIRVSRHIRTSRPTAVNLMWALDRMERCFYSTKSTLDRDDDSAVGRVRSALMAEALNIKNEDIRMCQAISENGLKLLEPGSRILTHCNAGHLAVSRYGTALGPIYLAHQKGYEVKVYADETRPLLQGARLTAFELNKAGIDVTLVCDNMASLLMRQGKIDMVFVGCDRVAANGDVANKIGTSSLAILAKYYKIPFYVLGPTSTIDFNCPDGDGIPIEERPSSEITDMYFKESVAPQGITVYNPAFDITPAELITGIITEKGIFKPGNLKHIFS